MSWNYRVIKRDGGYGIYEVYYNRRGKPDGCTVDPTWPYGESPKELRRDFKLMAKAFNKPVLDYEKAGGA